VLKLKNPDNLNFSLNDEIKSFEWISEKKEERAANKKYFTN